MADGWSPSWIDVVNRLSTREERQAFLEALLTPQEIEEFGRRWRILQLLDQGYPQRDVQQMVKVSIATVSRGAKELKYGSQLFKTICERFSSGSLFKTPS